MPADGVALVTQQVAPRWAWSTDWPAWRQPLARDGDCWLMPSVEVHSAHQAIMHLMSPPGKGTIKFTPCGNQDIYLDTRDANELRIPMITWGIPPQIMH
jgi:hypothetical protein